MIFLTDEWNGSVDVLIKTLQVIKDLEEQVRDVMFTLEAQHKLAEAKDIDASE